MSGPDVAILLGADRLRARRGGETISIKVNLQIERKAGRVVQDGMFQVLLRVSAWICLALIALVTLGPLGLRPESGMPPHVERFAAFAVAGVLFAAAYPRYIVFAAVIVLGAAVLLELLQLLAPSRHGRLFDAGVKVAGGMVGLCTGWMLARLSRAVTPPPC
jgi:hypothetical protein